MERRSLYSSRARLYDLIYQSKDYAAGAARIRDLLRGEGIEDGARLVEAACGTGSFLVHFREWYEVEGYDLEEGMLDVAREKLRDVRLFRADMCEHVEDPPADALVCAFSSIGYAYPETRLHAAIRCFADSVRPGGVVLVEPWITPENFHDGAPHLQTYEDDDIKLARSVVSRVEGRMSVLDMHWLVARRNEEVEHFVDRHELMMTTQEEMLAAFASAGLDARHHVVSETDDRGVYVAKKPEYGVTRTLRLGACETAKEAKGARNLSQRREEGKAAKSRGRDTSYLVPPAQIPACGTTALGSYLGW